MAILSRLLPMLCGSMAVMLALHVASISPATARATAGPTPVTAPAGQTPVVPAGQIPAAALPAQTGFAAQAHHAIATTNPAAQAAFDRGLLMLYAFNVGEARAAFRLAEAADPHAALPYFGEAVAETIDINVPTTADGERRGADAVRRGLRNTADAAADERALLAAAELRFDQRQPQPRRFSAYFSALQRYTQAHPTDGMGLTLAAYAGWNATGVLTGDPHDELTADAKQIAADLDAALKLDQTDLGAHHLRIHFWEQTHRPERALPDADYLAGLSYAPGQSHLPHMAGHIYDRLGAYDQMIRVNLRACENDDVYFGLGEGDGQHYMRRYHDHDVDFVLYGLTTLGRNDEARTFAAHGSQYDREIVAVRLHDNRSVLDLLGAAITPMRIVAEARLGDVADARRDLAGLGAGRGAGDVEINLATAALARAAHDSHAAIEAYRRADASAGSDLGDPKSRWWMPAGEGLGAALLESHQPAEAERIFRTELARYPSDPRLEFGLAQALAAQGKDDTAARAAYGTVWAGAQPLTLADLG